MGDRLLPPTARQWQVLRAYIRHGSTELAAHELGITPQAVKNRLHELNVRLGVKKTAQAVHKLWLGYRDHTAECSRRDHTPCDPLRP